MDDQQRQRINGAAREFTDALVAAYRTTSDGAAAAQQLSAQQIEYFFNTVMNNLRTQSEGTLQITQQVAAQQELARKATQDLTRVSTDNYMDFLDTMYSFYQGGPSRTQRRVEETQRLVEEAEARAQEAERARSEAERQTEVARKGTEEAQRRVEEAEKSARAAKRRVQKAERSAREAESRAEEAEGRTLEAERRAEEAERSKSEAENQGGDPEGEAEANADAVHRPQSKWVKTSGRPRVRGRNTTFQRRSPGRR
jgi:chromosome segregation ATPase